MSSDIRALSACHAQCSVLCAATVHVAHDAEAGVSPGNLFTHDCEGKDREGRQGLSTGQSMHLCSRPLPHSAPPGPQCAGSSATKAVHLHISATEAYRRIYKFADRKLCMRSRYRISRGQCRLCAFRLTPSMYLHCTSEAVGRRSEPRGLMRRM